MKKKLLIFDVDGTLRDSDDEVVEKFSRTLIKLKFGENRARKIARALIMKLEGPVNQTYHLMDRFGVDHYFRSFIEKFSKPKEMLIIDGVKEMLETLKEKYYLAVASARGATQTHKFLDDFGLKDYFDVVVTGDCTYFTKPYPHPLLYAASTVGVDIKDCIMIGDTPTDIKAANNAKCKSIAVLCGLGEIEELQRHGASLILQSTAELTSKHIDSLDYQ